MKHRLNWVTSLVCSLAISFAIVPTLWLSDPTPALADPTAPTEYPEVSLSRNARSPLTLDGNLSKNVYRYIEREITETVQVPYTVTVPYTDYESYTDYERRCDWYTQPVCRVENVCRDVTRYRDVCRRVEVCRNTPSGRRCHWENRCRQEPYTERQCSSQNVCRDNRIWDCRTIPVVRTRPVTRYRTETRYREEQRTRVITVPVFVRQYGVQVLVHFPAGSELESGELESIQLRLEGGEGNLDASLSIDSSIFSYRVVNKRKEGNSIHFELKMVSKYSEENVGPRSVDQIRIVPREGAEATSSRYDVVFVDRGRYPRVQTEYVITVLDQETGGTVDRFRTGAPSRPGEVVIPMPGTIQIAHDHRVTLEVNRKGLPLEAPVQFSRTEGVLGRINPAPFLDPNSVRQFEIVGKNKSARISFVDQSPRSTQVESQYEIVILHRRLGFLWKHEVGRFRVTQKEMLSQGNDRLSYSLASSEGFSETDFERYFDDGDNLFVEVRVIRDSARFGGQRNLSFTKEAKIKVRSQ